MAGGLLILQGPRVGCKMVEGPGGGRSLEDIPFSWTEQHILDGSDPSPCREADDSVPGVV